MKNTKVKNVVRFDYTESSSAINNNNKQ